MQAQGISRFNGELYVLEARIARIDAAILRAACAWKAYAPSSRPAALVPHRWIGGLRLCVGATAIAALATLPAMIISMLA